MTRAGRLTLLLSLTLLVLFVASLVAGRTSVTLLQALVGLASDDPSLIGLVVQQIRLPRSLLALLIGASLGLAGAALQGLLRNPLAEPGLIGTSSCAALGAVLAFYSGLSLDHALALPLGGLAGALLAVALLYALAGRDSSPLTLILAGVALNSLAGALTSLALNLSSNPFAAYEIFFWLM
ncbi:MAG: iron chelate uptake ABC transporter family permease subunit, partial [Candidatus Competibacterales bacterium]|nr:iron chelate uptake ABC transporter family permease subunit [Candidatus Competibacterales bacterium]